MVLDIKVPFTNLSFYEEKHVAEIKRKTNNIMDKFGKEIKQASLLTNVPEKLNLAVSFIESSGDASALSPSKAAGLMQIDADTATNVIWKENRLKRLSEAEKVIIKKTLGSRLNCILEMQFMNQKRACNKNTGKVVTIKDLFNVEFNTLIGSMLLGQLIDEHVESGKARLDKVIVRYNAGMNYKPQGNTVAETMAFAKKKGGSETVNYITKLGGKFGLLDILKNG